MPSAEPKPVAEVAGEADPGTLNTVLAVAIGALAVRLGVVEGTKLRDATGETVWGEADGDFEGLPVPVGAAESEGLPEPPGREAVDAAETEGEPEGAALAEPPPPPPPPLVLEVEDVGEPEKMADKVAVLVGEALRTGVEEEEAEAHSVPAAEGVDAALVEDVLLAAEEADAHAVAQPDAVEEVLKREGLCAPLTVPPAPLLPVGEEDAVGAEEIRLVAEGEPELHAVDEAREESVPLRLCSSEGLPPPLPPVADGGVDGEPSKPPCELLVDAEGAPIVAVVVPLEEEDAEGCDGLAVSTPEPVELALLPPVKLLVPVPPLMLSVAAPLIVTTIGVRVIDDVPNAVVETHKVVLALAVGSALLALAPTLVVPLQLPPPSQPLLLLPSCEGVGRGEAVGRAEAELEGLPEEDAHGEADSAPLLLPSFVALPLLLGGTLLVALKEDVAQLEDVGVKVVTEDSDSVEEVVAELKGGVAVADIELQGEAVLSAKNEGVALPPLAAGELLELADAPLEREGSALALAESLGAADAVGIKAVPLAVAEAKRTVALAQGETLVEEVASNKPVALAKPGVSVGATLALVIGESLKKLVLLAVWQALGDAEGVPVV